MTRPDRTVLSFMLFLGTAGAVITPVTTVQADSWAMPEQTVYQSPNKGCRVTVTPREIGSQLRYFERKIAETEGKAQPQPGFAQAKAECKDQKGRWQKVWSGLISNEVAPVEVLVSNGARRVVTFDNWHQVGYGDNVVVIYNETGQLLGRYALEELVPAEYIEALPHSVSSIHWRGEPRIDEQANRLIVPLAVPTLDRTSDQKDYIEVVFDLSNGEAIRPSGAQWEQALARAQEVNIADKKAEQTRLVYLTEPLFGPKSKAEPDWHGYLQEAYLRLTPNLSAWAGASTTVLFHPRDENYETSKGWVSTALADLVEFPGDDASIATVGPPDDLVMVLRKAASGLKPDALRGSTIYVAVPVTHRDQVAAIIAPTGAKFVWLDPETGIPQRPERIPGSPEEAASQERMRKEMNDDAMEAAKEASKK
jgi:hypothetical protein